MTNEVSSREKCFEGPLSVIEPECMGKIILALHDDRYDFRTLHGINEQIDISPGIIEYALEPDNGLARISPMTSENNETLYRPASSPLTVKEKAEKVRIILARDFT